MFETIIFKRFTALVAIWNSIARNDYSLWGTSGSSPEFFLLNSLQMAQLQSYTGETAEDTHQSISGKGEQALVAMYDFRDLLGTDLMMKKTSNACPIKKKRLCPYLNTDNHNRKSNRYSCKITLWKPLHLKLMKYHQQSYQHGSVQIIRMIGQPHMFWPL